MYQINYEIPVHIHFIGIGGISMSGLAAVLLKRGFTGIRIGLRKNLRSQTG